MSVYKSTFVYGSAEAWVIRAPLYTLAMLVYICKARYLQFVTVDELIIYVTCVSMEGHLVLGFIFATSAHISSSSPMGGLLLGDSAIGKASLKSSFLSSISCLHLCICEQSGPYGLWEEDRFVHLGLTYRVFKSSLVSRQTFYQKPPGEQTNRKVGSCLGGPLR